MYLQLICVLLVSSIGIQALNDEPSSVDNLLTCADICVCANVTQHERNGTLPYRPVVLLHGLMGGAIDLTRLSVRIQQAQPGTLIFTINCFSRLESKGQLWKQVRRIGAEIVAIGEQFPDGINLIGHNQGGLIARVILQIFPNHNVRNFISIAAPQAGYCGYGFLPCKEVYKIFYTKWGQISAIGNTWNDPQQQERYLNNNTFLPVVNNEHQLNSSSGLKVGIIKLQKMVLIGGPDDEMIRPWQSSQFGFWKNNDTIIEELRNRTIYQNDSIGLKTLDESKKLILQTVPGVKHIEWLWNTTVIDQYIIPHLD